MAAMAKLRPAVDAFFDKVTVNADDKALRANRLILLNRIREATRDRRRLFQDRRLTAATLRYIPFMQVAEREHDIGRGSRSRTRIW